MLKKFIFTAIIVILLPIEACTVQTKEIPTSTPVKKTSPTATSINQTPTIEKFSIEDLSIYDSKTKKLITIGMDKKEVEKIISPQKIKLFDEISRCYDYDGFWIYYNKDNKVVSFQILYAKEITYRFSIFKGIGANSTLDDARDKYGFSDIDNNGIDVTYYFEKKGNDLIKIKSTEYKEKLSNPKTTIYAAYFGSGNNSKGLGMVMINIYECETSEELKKLVTPMNYMRN